MDKTLRQKHKTLQTVADRSRHKCRQMIALHTSHLLIEITLNYKARTCKDCLVKNTNNPSSLNIDVKSVAGRLCLEKNLNVITIVTAM